MRRRTKLDTRQLFLLMVSSLGLTVATITQAADRELFTPDAAPRPVVLIDYYHHSDPSLAVGDIIRTGGYADNLGRYAINDFHHTNSFDPLAQTLEKSYALAVHRAPLTADHLRGADIVVLFTPDSKQLNPKTPLITEQEIDDLDAFVKGGGSLLLMVNSYHPTERMDQVQMRKLFRRFGLDWNQDDTKYTDIAVGPLHPWFYDIDVFHYGAGCTLAVLPGADAEVMFTVVGDVGNEKVKGPGIVRVRHGKGKAIAVGDTGSWTGNMSRPWTDNPRFLLQLMDHLKRDTGVSPPRYPTGQPIRYSLSAARTRIIPVNNTLSDLSQPGYRLFEPRPRTRIAYTELRGDLTLTCTETLAGDAKRFGLAFDKYRSFDQPLDLGDDPTIHVTTARNGAIAQIDAPTPALRELSPQTACLFAFIPNDGIRIGDRWVKRLALAVPTVRGADHPPDRNVELEFVYAKDGEARGRQCRLFIAMAHVPLDKLNIAAADILPAEMVQRSPDRYELRNGRGGSFLIKLEQWIERDSGIVVEARMQSRYVIWVQDKQTPAGPSIADIDNKNIVVASEDTRWATN